MSSGKVKVDPQVNFPDDVVQEILKALPVESVLRMRCVCKQWRALIGDPNFINLHRITSYHRPGGVKLVTGFERRSIASLEGQQFLFKLVDLDGNAPERLQSLTLPTSAIGFDSGSQGVEGLSFDGYAVWNPSIRKRFFVNNGFRLSSEFSNTWALGFDSEARQYKVVHMHLWDIPSSIRVRVLTLGTNLWREIDTNCVPKEALTATFIDTGVYAQNKIFFKVERVNSVVGVLVFWVGEETFQFLPAPTKGMDKSMRWLTIELGNSVALLSSKEVWILRDVTTQKWDHVIYGKSLPWLFPWGGSKVIGSIDNSDEVLVLMNIYTRWSGTRTHNLVLEAGGSLYWDVKKMISRPGPNHRGHVFTKLVETLFDPTLVRNPQV